MRAASLIALSPAHLGERALTLSNQDPMAGADVRELQQRLKDLGYGVPLDGIYGSVTERAVRRLQNDYGIYNDGVCGDVTVRILSYLERNMISIANPATPKMIRVISWSASRQHSGMVLVDPIYRSTDSAPSEENDVLVVVRDAIEHEIRAVAGMQTAHLPGIKPRTEVCRAETVNGMKAELLLLLDVRSSTESSDGVETYYFGDEEMRSDIGEPLSRYIHEELVRTADAPDGGVHPERSELLEKAEAPVVLINIGNLRGAVDRPRLVYDPEYPELIAKGVALGVRKLYLFGGDQQATESVLFRSFSKRASIS
jgi:hypothetical protein